MEYTFVFKGCEEMAVSLADKLKALTKAQADIETEKFNVLVFIKNKVKELFAEKEQNFLNLKTTGGTTVIEFIADHIVAGPSVVLQHIDKTRLMLDDFLLIKIISDEINNAGFCYDSGRKELKAVVQSIMDKFGIPLMQIEFDYDESYVLAIHVCPTEFDF